MLKPFFSIILTTYNSSKFVVDALESVKNQNFNDFELIICDDASTDNTVEIVNEWLKKNLSFRRNLGRLVLQKENLGVAKNENSGIKIAKGKWIHVLAGDDVLMPDALQNIFGFIHKNPHIHFLQGIAMSYNEDFSDENFVNILCNKNIFAKATTAELQYRQLLKTNFIISSATFFQKSALEKIGNFDETVKNIDDWTTYLNLTKSGEKFTFVDKILALYRIHYQSLCQHTDKFFLTGQHRSNRPVFKQYINPNVNFFTKIKNELIFLGKEFVFRFCNKKSNFLGKILFSSYNYIRRVV
ncbi:MAG: glycosyltransferase [Bacteroidales bacterium]|jgi:alpha-1,3-rhamnosyltransferase|nr:glycosyltransferase [Bacteroidales bacterium]